MPKRLRAEDLASVVDVVRQNTDGSRRSDIAKGHDRDKRIRCAISEEALEDHFHADNRSQLEVFRENSPAIEEIARRKYLSG